MVGAEGALVGVVVWGHGLLGWKQGRGKEDGGDCEGADGQGRAPKGMWMRGRIQDEVGSAGGSGVVPAPYTSTRVMAALWKQTRGRTRGRWVRPGAVLGCALALLVLAMAGGRGVSAAAGDVGAARVAAGRVTGVREADASCAKCHAAIYAKYVESPMANGSGVATEHFLPGAMRDAASGMEYRVELRAGQPVLEFAKAGGAAGAGTFQGERRLEYFLGSGRLGTTYLYSEDGYLMESPVAWYSRLKGYAMAPGLEGLKAMPAALPMEPGCMRCHMSDVQRVEAGSRDHFAGLPFLHGGVTCEGCHGDATAHVQTGGKASVLNPMKMDAVARDAVCASCHLEGDVSVERKGRSTLDYKPGERLDSYVTHFVLEQGSTKRSVSETEQLLTSRCKRESGDRMSCMSCHDAHGDPSPEERVAFYRGKCLQCHGTNVAFVKAHFPEQPDCTSCHMPKNGAMDTPHVAWTDHRLLQRPGAAGTGTGASGGLQLGGISEPASVEALHPVLPTEQPTARDLALAYYKALGKGHGELAREAWARLNAVAATDRTDPAVLVALGYMNGMQGRTAEARGLLEEALRLRPADAEARSDLATLLAKTGDLPGAVSAERVVWAENESVEAVGVNLGVLECASGQTAEGQATLQTVLRFSPDSHGARTAMAGCGVK